MSCLLSTGGLYCEDLDVIKMSVITGVESRRKDTHRYSYAGLSFPKLLGGKMSVCLFSWGYKVGNTLIHHTVIITWKKQQRYTELPKVFAVSATIHVHVNGIGLMCFVSNIYKTNKLKTDISFSTA